MDAGNTMPLFFALSLGLPPYPWPPLDLYPPCCTLESTGQLGKCVHVQICVDLCADHGCLALLTLAVEGLSLSFQYPGKCIESKPATGSLSRPAPHQDY